MGTEYSLILYINETQDGNRPEARKLFERLTAKVKG